MLSSIIKEKIKMKLKSLVAVAALILLGIGITPLANATYMTAELTGYVTAKPAPFLNATSVKVGDTFGFTFQFDDAEQSSQPYFANGRTYNLISQPISPSLMGWAGTLSDEFARFSVPESGSITGYGNIASIYLGPTLDHSEWVFTSTGGAWFKVVTQFKGTLGYGWWGVGGGGPGTYWDYTGARDFGYISITGLNVRPVLAAPIAPIPEPATYAILLSGLGLLGFTRRSRKNLSAYPVLHSIQNRGSGSRFSFLDLRRVRRNVVQWPIDASHTGE